MNDVEVESANVNTFLKKFVEMTFNLEEMSMYTFNWMLLDPWCIQ